MPPLTFRGRQYWNRAVELLSAREAQGVRIGPLWNRRRYITERWMLRVLEALLSLRNGPVLDIGANLGQTLLKVKHLDRGRPWIGFEPNPYCVAKLEQVIRVNRFPACTVIPAGLSDRTGIVDLQRSGADLADSAATLVEQFRSPSTDARTQPVCVVTWALAECYLRNQPTGIVKIDVEGAELEALLSLSDAIRKWRPALLLEVLPAYSPDNAFRVRRQTQVQDLLQGWNYDLFHVRKNSSDHLEGLTRISAFGVHSDLTRCDYVSVPGEESSRFEKLFTS